jgi:CheY-like chemotaxis protein
MTVIGGSRVATRVLLVEDSPGDVRLTREAFRNADASIELHVAPDGVEALAFLRHQRTCDGTPTATLPMRMGG